MLMQEVEVRSSTGQYDRSHIGNYVAGSASAFDCNRGAIERITTLLSVNDARSHATAYKASTGTQTVWNRIQCARSQQECDRSHY